MKLSDILSPSSKRALIDNWRASAGVHKRGGKYGPDFPIVIVIREEHGVGTLVLSELSPDETTAWAIWQSGYPSSGRLAPCRGPAYFCNTELGARSYISFVPTEPVTLSDLESDVISTGCLWLSVVRLHTSVSAPNPTTQPHVVCDQCGETIGVCSDHACFGDHESPLRLTSSDWRYSLSITKELL